MTEAEKNADFPVPSSSEEGPVEQGGRHGGSMESSTPAGGEMRWYVIRAKTRAEGDCLAEFDKHRVRALCPMIWEYRWRRRRREKTPLFPGYVFARFAYPEQYHVVRWARGVSHLVRFGEADPPALGDHVIEDLIGRMDADGVMDAAPDLKPGTSVQFRSEPLKGLVGTVLRTKSAQGRVQVLMNLLYQAKMEVDSYHLKVL